MEPESRPSATQSDTTDQDRMQVKETAMEKCWSAYETGNMNNFNGHIQGLFGQLSNANIKTLLHSAIKRDWIQSARLLLEQGADPKLMCTPLTVIASYCPSVDMLKLLAEYGLDYTSGQHNMLVFVLLRRETLDWLLDQGVDINARDGDHRSVYGIMRSYHDKTVVVLNRAAGLGDIELFDHLVVRGAIPSRSLALHYASRSKNVNTSAMIAHLIKKYGFDVNANEECGGLNEVSKWVATGCPLNWAATASNTPAIETLLGHGAHTGTTCEISIKKKDTASAKVLLDAGADASASLGTALIEDYVEGARLCLEHGGDIVLGKAWYEKASKISGLSAMSTEMKDLLSIWS